MRERREQNPQIESKQVNDPREDPGIAETALFDGEALTDLASNHDEYLYGPVVED